MDDCGIFIIWLLDLQRRQIPLLIVEGGYGFRVDSFVFTFPCACEYQLSAAVYRRVADELRCIGRPSKQIEPGIQPGFCRFRLNPASGIPGIVLSSTNHFAICGFRSVNVQLPHGIRTLSEQRGIPAYRAVAVGSIDLRIEFLPGKPCLQVLTASVNLCLLGSLLRRQSAGSRRCRQKADCDKEEGKNPQKTEPEAGLLIIQNRKDSSFYTDLAEGNRTGSEVGATAGTAKERGGVRFPFIQLHKANDTLIAGHFNVLAQ